MYPGRALREMNNHVVVVLSYENRDYGPLPGNGPSWDLHPNVLETNFDDWSVTGKLWEDVYSWVHHFEATHPLYGHVSGCLDQSLRGSTQAINHFLATMAQHNMILSWDPGDI